MANSLDLNAANDKDIVVDYGLGLNFSLFDKKCMWANGAIIQCSHGYAHWVKAYYECTLANNLQFSESPNVKKKGDSEKNFTSKWNFKNSIISTFEDTVKNTRVKFSHFDGGVIRSEKCIIGSLRNALVGNEY